MKDASWIYSLSFNINFFFSFLSFVVAISWAAPAAYEGSQARVESEL